MALRYSPKITTDGLVMCLDPSQNKSYPTDLPVKNGLLVWLDAADDTTFSYSSGTIVSQWRDKSGNNFHANQSTTSQQPSRSSVMNSRKGVFFNASTRLDYMLISSGISVPTDASIFIIYKPATQVYNYAVLIDNYHGLGGNYGFVIQRVNDLSQFYYANAGDGTGFIDTAASPWTYTDNVIQLLSLNKSGATATPYISGTTQTARTVRAATAQYTTGLSIGFLGNGGGRFYNGDMCEILIFNRSLSSTEMKQVHTYLGQKWGVSNTDRSIVDLSNNNNHGLLGGLPGSQVVADMPLFDVYNKGALKLDGSTDYISVENATSLNPTTVTVSIWVKRNGYQSSIASYLRRNYNDAYGITGDIAADNVRFRIHNGTNYPESPNATLSLNEWTNIVGTYDLANIKIYKNGVFVGQTAHTSAISYASANTTLTIGRDDPVAGRYMNANYGSVLIYSRALSATEISQNYEAQKSKFANTIVQQGLVLNLDAGNIYSYAGAGATWIDVSGAVNDFAAVGSPTYSTNEFILNGTTQYFSLFTAASGFFINNTNNFYADVGYAWSVSVWFKFPVSPTSVRDATINAGNCSYCMFGNSGGIGGGETLSLFVSGISGTTAGVHPYYCMMGLRGAKTQLSVDPVNTNVWNNVVVTWNGSAGRGYFNGVDRGALNNNVGAGLQVSGYTIGTTGSGATGHLFEGSIAQTFVYNRAISASEVLQNYNALKGRFGL
jgi:hypothetical protein